MLMLKNNIKVYYDYNKFKNIIIKNFLFLHSK